MADSHELCIEEILISDIRLEFLSKADGGAASDDNDAEEEEEEKEEERGNQEEVVVAAAVVVDADVDVVFPRSSPADISGSLVEKLTSEISRSPKYENEMRHLLFFFKTFLHFVLSLS